MASTTDTVAITSTGAFAGNVRGVSLETIGARPSVRRTALTIVCAGVVLAVAVLSIAIPMKSGAVTAPAAHAAAVKPAQPAN